MLLFPHDIPYTIVFCYLPMVDIVIINIKFISPLTAKNSCCREGQFKLKLAIVLIASKYRYITYTTV